jgi:ABC-type multidrug transport system fused ATPase/permease subunit
LLFFRLTPRLSDLQMIAHDIISVLPSSVRIDELCAAAAAQPERIGGAAFAGLRRGIRLDDVWFAYRGKEPVLRGIALECRKGEMVALVGSSGCGKTTVVDLVMGFISPTRGTVMVDGVSIDTLNRDHWHQAIGYVPQDVNLFNDTVRANLLWGHPGATEADLAEAVRRADAEDFILELPRGYESVIGSRGVLLSGGQRQRLALARALIRNPEVLILDEATSALDAESERMIQHTIESLARRMTLIVVAHRLSTIQKADRIYVLEGGRIAEVGTWDELRMGNGRFNELRRLQALV